MKEKLILGFKGMLLGLAFIIPGVSGGTIAFVVGLYERIIEAVNHFYESVKSFKKYIVFLLSIGVGILVSVVIGSKLIGYSIDKFPLPTFFLFIGLVSGSIPSLMKNVKGAFRKKKSNFIFFLIGGIIILALSLIKSGADNVVLDSLTFGKAISLFFVGIVASATMVIPGISGSFMLMIMGYYEPLISVINNVTSFTNTWTNVLILIPFGIGVVLGILMIARLIEWLLSKYRIQTFMTIMGFVIASIIEIFIRSFSYTYTMPHILAGCVLMVVATIFTYKAFGNS